MGAFVVPALRLLLWTRTLCKALSSPHAPTLRPSQLASNLVIRLYWGVRLFSLPSTFRCGRTLCRPLSYKDTPSVRVISPSHFCSRLFIMDVPSTRTSPFMGWLDLPSVAQWGWMLCGSVHSFVRRSPFLSFARTLESKRWILKILYRYDSLCMCCD